MQIIKITLGIGVAVMCAFPVMAGGHRHHCRGNDGVRLAANIIGVVGAALRQQVPVPIVITPPPPPPRYLVPPPRHHHRIRTYHRPPIYRRAPIHHHGNHRRR